MIARSVVLAIGTRQFVAPLPDRDERSRALAAAIERDLLGGDERSRALAAAIECDLVGRLRHAEWPKCHLAAAGAT